MNVIGTAGHVDHGKSTLVRRLTGIDPDRFAEEKRRGMTLDLGFAWLTLPSGVELGLIDVPGHENLVRNMLAGAGGISLCLFVVAADEGWKPQSAEHLSILHALDVRAGVVALTKSDVASADVGTVRDVVRRRLEPSSLRDAEIVPCSAVTGEGLPELLDALDRAVARTSPGRDSDRLRLWIDRSFTMKGAGTVVTGTLTGGTMARGDEIELLPQHRRARVRAIQSHKREVEMLGPGSRCALNLVGVERGEVARGDVAVQPGRWTLTRRVDARLSVPSREISGIDVALTQRGSHLLYVGSSETSVRIKLLDADSIAPGESAFAQLTLAKPLPLSQGDRFVLRDAGPNLTIGGGVVLDPHPDVTKGNDVARLALLRELEADPEDALRALVDHEGAIAEHQALARSGASEVPGDIARLGVTLVSASRMETLITDLEQTVGAHHEREPMSNGIPRAQARAELDLDPDAFEDLLERTSVRDLGGRLALPGHHPGMAAELSEQGRKLVAALDAAGFRPPLERDLGADPALVRALVSSGALVRVGDFLLTGGRATEAIESVRAHIARTGPVTVADIRDLLGTSRKYAVPLCEWLDRSGVTVRRGDLRYLGSLS